MSDKAKAAREVEKILLIIRELELDCEKILKGMELYPTVQTIRASERLQKIIEFLAKIDIEVWVIIFKLIGCDSKGLIDSIKKMIADNLSEEEGIKKSKDALEKLKKIVCLLIELAKLQKLAEPINSKDRPDSKNGAESGSNRLPVSKDDIEALDKWIELLKSLKEQAGETRQTYEEYRVLIESILTQLIGVKKLLYKKEFQFITGFFLSIFGVASLKELIKKGNDFEEEFKKAGKAAADSQVIKKKLAKLLRKKIQEWLERYLKRKGLTKLIPYVGVILTALELFGVGTDRLLVSDLKATIRKLKCGLVDKLVEAEYGWPGNYKKGDDPYFYIPKRLSPVHIRLSLTICCYKDEKWTCCPLKLKGFDGNPRDSISGFVPSKPAGISIEDVIFDESLLEKIYDKKKKLIGWKIKINIDIESLETARCYLGAEKCYILVDFTAVRFEKGKELIPEGKPSKGRSLIGAKNG